MGALLVRKRAETQAMLFAAFLVVTIFIFSAVVFTNTDSVIGSTEMNANAMVEYLCMGSDCENMAAMAWSD